MLVTSTVLIKFSWQESEQTFDIIERQIIYKWSFKMEAV